MVIKNVVLQEVEVNEAQLEDKSVGTLFKWLKSGEKPEKCSKDGSDLYIYWCNFRDFRIFGKNVHRCHDKSECGVHFQYVVLTDDRPEVLIKLHNDPMSGLLGFDRTFEKLKQRFYWSSYRQELDEFINKCEICALAKAPLAFTRQPNTPIVASHTFKIIT